ncbi:ATP-binding protein [Sphingomonas bacterium]|uniref:ATP-binding protein n=1 Tax=Sphingomonas bacterium TaxID=1895847 RepID=UPI001576BB39|nr:ATP-binding protein [Sphingomonas bacterium]
MTVAPTTALLGVSGAGKSWLAARIVARRPEFVRLSAGRLLREALHTTGKALRTAPSNDVLQNQNRLVEVFRKAREGQLDRPILLEAHAFIDNDRELVDVPVEVMRALGVDGLLVLVTSPELIQARRAEDPDRRRPERTFEDLAHQQKYMLAIARNYARQLPARMAVIQSGDVDGACRFLDQVRGSLPG